MWKVVKSDDRRQVREGRWHGEWYIWHFVSNAVPVSFSDLCLLMKETERERVTQCVEWEAEYLAYNFSSFLLSHTLQRIHKLKIRIAFYYKLKEHSVIEYGECEEREGELLWHFVTHNSRLVASNVQSECLLFFSLHLSQSVCTHLHTSWTVNVRRLYISSVHVMRWFILRHSYTRTSTSTHTHTHTINRHCIPCVCIVSCSNCRITLLISSATSGVFRFTAVSWCIN